MDYVILIEPALDGTYSAYVPDLPGCASSSETLEELHANITEAVQGHIESLRETRQPIPVPTSLTATVHAA
jgi:predicted RNase H-like HicB family nuclease